MNDVRENLLKTACDTKYLVHENRDKKYITGIATKINTCEEDRALMLSCLSFKTADETITDIETLKAKFASDEKVIAHAFVSFIPCCSGNDFIDLGWMMCKDFKYDRSLKGYTIRVCSI